MSAVIDDQRMKRINDLAARICIGVSRFEEPADIVLIALGKALASAIVTSVPARAVGVVTHAAVGTVQLEVQALTERRGQPETGNG